MSNDLLGKHEVLQVNGSKTLAKNKLCWDATLPWASKKRTQTVTSQQKKQKRSPRTQCPLQEDTWLPWLRVLPLTHDSHNILPFCVFSTSIRAAVWGRTAQAFVCAMLSLEKRFSI